MKPKQDWLPGHEYEEYREKQSRLTVTHHFSVHFQVDEVQAKAIINKRWGDVELIPRSIFPFKFDNKSLGFCLAIAEYIVNKHSVDYRHAIHLIGDRWKQLDLSDPADIMYHRYAEDWADDIVYEPGWQAKPKDKRKIRDYKMPS